MDKQTTLNPQDSTRNHHVTPHTSLNEFLPDPYNVTTRSIAHPSQHTPKPTAFVSHVLTSARPFSFHHMTQYSRAPPNYGARSNILPPSSFSSSYTSPPGTSLEGFPCSRTPVSFHTPTPSYTGDTFDTQSHPNNSSMINSRKHSPHSRSFPMQHHYPTHSFSFPTNHPTDPLYQMQCVVPDSSSALPSFRPPRNVSFTPPHRVFHRYPSHQHNPLPPYTASSHYPSPLYSNKRSNPYVRSSTIPPYQTSSIRPQRCTKKATYCNVCDKDFFSHERYKQHIDNDHYSCDHPGCNYSAPFVVLDAHKLRHIKGENRNAIFDDPNEIQLWIDARRRNFPAKTANQAASIEKTVPCAIEKILRQQNLLQKNLGRASIEKSALVPQLQSLLRRERQWKMEDFCKKLHRTSTNRRAGFSSEYSFRNLTTDFPICEHFLKFKTCKWSPCHYSHDIAAYRRWKIQRNLHGLDIAMRPPLLYKLLLPEIREVESFILAALRFIVNNNFFRKDSDPPLHVDSQSLSEDSDSDVISVTSLNSTP